MMKKILAIDDQKDNLTTIKAVIKSNIPNCEVLAVLSGKEGIALAQKEQPDVILLDIIMPQMDGYEVCQKLKADELTKHIPILMITAIKTDSTSRVKGLELGADAFLSKPIDAIELSAQVKVMLRIKEAEDKLRKEKDALKEDVSNKTYKLDESEKRYKALYDNAPLPFHSLNSEGKIISVNPAWLATLGYNRDEVINKWYGDFLHDDWKPIFKKNFPTLKKCGYVNDIPFRLRCKDGAYIDISLNGSSSYNLDGSFKQTYCVFQDVTEQKKAEEALLENESKMRAVFEAAKDVAFITTDMQGQDSKVLSFSKGAEKIFGYKAEEIIGQNISILHTDAFEFEKNQFDLKTGNSNSTELELIRKSGECFTAIFSHHPIYDKNGEVIGKLGVTIDISDRKKTELALIETKELFSLFMQYSPVHTFIKEVNSGESRVLQASENFKEMIGIKGVDMIGKTMEELFPIEFAKKITADDIAVIEKGNVLQLDEDLNDRNYTTIKFPLNMGDKKLLAGFSIDITERVQAEKALQNRERIYSTLINNLPGFTYRCHNDKDWTIDFISAGCEDITGYSPDDFMSKKISFNDVIDVRFEKKIRALWNKVIKAKTNFEYEYKIITKNKETKWVWERGCGIYSDKGDFLYLEGFITDVTEDKRNEQIQKVLYNISNAVVTSISLKDFIGLIKIELGTLLDTTNFYIAFYDKDTDMFSSPFVRDEKDGFTTWPAGKSFSAYVLKSKKSLLVTKSEMLKMHADGLVELVGTPSEVWMGIPLISDGVVSGIFAVQSYTNENAYSKSDLEFLEIIADQISISVDRKKSDLKIKKSEEILQLALKTAGLGYFEWRLEYVHYKWNEQMYKIFELDITPDVDPHESFINILHPEDKEKIIKSFAKALDPKNKETYFKNEYRIICNNRIKYINANAIHFKDENGNVIRIIGTCQDITDLKIAERQIVESEERFDLAMKASRDGLYDWNLLNNDVYYSARWKNILGYENEELENDLSVWESLTCEEDKTKSLDKLKDAIGKKVKHYDVEFKMKHKLGHWVDILSRAELIYDEDGKAIRIVGTHSDLTEQKRAEQKLKTALTKATESDRLKSVFLATMSHELRTPLNAIIGFSDIIDENLPSDKVAEFSKIINASGTHLLNIVEDMFDVTLIESGAITIVKEDVKLQTILSDVHSIINVELLKTGKDDLDLNLKVDIDFKHLIINTDPSKLKQILINLLKNALKFTHEGSVQYGFSIEKDKKALKFFVKDTGIGIPKEKQRFIFDMFRQEANSGDKLYGGTGIGLSISKKLTELLGGEIWLESEVGEGTAFYFTIPFELNKTEDKGSVENEISSIKVVQETKNSLKKTVLIVEDVEASFEFLKVVLEKQGMNTVWAENGKIAVDHCKKNPDIDLVLMDINMPVMNGFEATKIIKDFKPELPIIAQTAYAIVGDKQKSMDAGCDDYISKPIKQGLLISKIEKYLGKLKD